MALDVGSQVVSSTSTDNSATGGAVIGEVDYNHFGASIGKDGFTFAVDKNDINITLLESSQTSSAGVGESTWPSMRATLAKIGISETELIRRCDATFKQGAKFVSWRLNDKNEFKKKYFMMKIQKE